MPIGKNIQAGLILDISMCSENIIIWTDLHAGKNYPKVVRNITEIIIL